jgi:hypothetical protein
MNHSPCKPRRGDIHFFFNAHQSASLTENEMTLLRGLFGEFEEPFSMEAVPCIIFGCE